MRLWAIDFSGPGTWRQIGTHFRNMSWFPQQEGNLKKRCPKPREISETDMQITWDGYVKTIPGLKKTMCWDTGMGALANKGKTLQVYPTLSSLQPLTLTMMELVLRREKHKRCFIACLCPYSPSAAYNHHTSLYWGKGEELGEIKRDSKMNRTGVIVQDVTDLIV